MWSKTVASSNATNHLGGVVTYLVTPPREKKVKKKKKNKTSPEDQMTLPRFGSEPLLSLQSQRHAFTFTFNLLPSKTRQERKC